jgi:hypothetical protein
VTYRVPLWVRALLAVDRAGIRAASIREGLRDELLLAWIPPSDRASLTAALYARQSTYLPGGYRFRSGLFAWERRALDSAFFPRSGRVLLGACGAGRELVELVLRGFDVVAFDPCAEFADAARRVAPRATVLQASYADLIAASSGRGGPLASAVAAPFDATWLGWGSLSHVTPSSDRLALLRALRAVAPRAPVLTSFALEPDTDAPPGSKGRVRDALRRVFSSLGAPGISEAGDHFYPDAGFLANLASDELMKLAFEAGYEVALFEEAPYPHAILAPLATSASAADASSAGV